MNPSEMVMMGILAGQTLPYVKKPVNESWVANGMQEVLNQWNTVPELLMRMYQSTPTPILIKAPTGTGKTTFIVEKLTQVAADHGECVLMLVNRTALVKQVLNDKCKFSLGYTFSPSSLGGINRVRNLIVLTYQQFAGDYNKVWSDLALPPNIRYVVMDEAHFFTADASFNYQTSNIFQNILAYSYDKQRIYMSATPELVKEIIAYEEYVAMYRCLYYRLYNYAVNDRNLFNQTAQEKNNNPINNQDLYASYLSRQDEVNMFIERLPKCILEYDFPPRPYDVHLKFFSRWDNIVDIIKKSDFREQWLIFVSKEEDGEYLESKLDGFSVFVTARKKGRILERLEQTAKFTQRVLITTSVLDNGINIKNDNLKNVVIDSTDSVQLRQMLGRKRVNENETVNLYVLNKTSADFESYCKSIELRIGALNSFETKYNEFVEKQYDNYDYEIRRLFPYNSNYGRRFTNNYLRYCLGQKHSEYINLLGALADDKDAFAKEVCNWLGVKFCPEMVMPDTAFDDALKQIMEIILKHTDPFDEQELVKVRDKMWSILEPVKIKGMTFEEGRIKGNVNKNLKILSEHGFSAYHVKKENKMFSFHEGLERGQKSTPPQE